MRTMYLLARPVLMSLKWLTSSLAWSPTKPSRSEGIIHDGTARMHKVCTTPQPTSVALAADGTYAALVCRPVEGSLVEVGSMSMLSIVTGPYRQSLVAISLDAFLGGIERIAVSGGWTTRSSGATVQRASRRVTGCWECGFEYVCSRIWAEEVGCSSLRRS
ncbi:hypothetical protein KCU99_g242, partial [Aureobasidium melanogenum]